MVIFKTMNKLFYTTIIPLFFFLNIFNSFSREVKKDTLKLKKELKTYNYNQLDSLYIDANRKIDSIRMYAIAGQMLEKAKQENKSQYYIRGYQFLSITDRMLGKYKKSLKHINRAVFYIEETGKYDRKDRIYLSKGAVHQDLGEYDLALDSYIKGFSYVGEEKRTTKISFYHNIASLKSFLFDAQGALEDYLKILKLIEEDKNEEYNSKEINRLFCLNQIARVHIDLGNYQQALTYCNEVIKNREFIEKKENLNNRAILVEAYLGFGNIYSLTGFYKKALSYLEEANKLNNTVNTDYLKVFIHFFKARTFFFLENYKEAISQLKIVESINDKNNFNHLYLEEMNILFAKSYQKQGDLKIATDYFNKSLKTIKNNEKRKIRLNNNILKKYDLSTLSKDLAIAELKLKKQKRYVKTFLTIFLITLLTSLGSYIHVRIKNKRRFNNLMTEFYFSNIRTDTKKMELIDKVGSVEIKKRK